MGVKSDSWIREQAMAGMIEPFVDRQVGDEDGRRVISYGLSSYGYDMRLADEFQVFRWDKDMSNRWINPKDFMKEVLVDMLPYIEKLGAVVELPPNSYALGRSLERFRIPREVLGLCLGKSSYARCGIGINITPLEPEWEGYVTIEIANHSHLPAFVYANEGIAQVIFLGADRYEASLRRDVCEVSYADRLGKYQGQTGITLPRV